MFKKKVGRPTEGITDKDDFHGDLTEMTKQKK